MKRSISVILLLAMLVALFAACNKGGVPSPTESDTANGVTSAVAAVAELG